MPITVANFDNIDSMSRDRQQPNSEMQVKRKNMDVGDFTCDGIPYLGPYVSKLYPGRGYCYCRSTGKILFAIALFWCITINKYENSNPD